MNLISNSNLKFPSRLAIASANSNVNALLDSSGILTLATVSVRSKSLAFPTNLRDTSIQALANVSARSPSIRDAPTVLTTSSVVVRPKTNIVWANVLAVTHGTTTSAHALNHKVVSQDTLLSMEPSLGDRCLKFVLRS